MSKATFEKKYKSTIDLLYQYIKDDKTRKKPIIPHVLRVGKYLYDKNYSDAIVKAGLLHDVIEWTDISPEFVKDKYGEYVFNIISANTKDRNIKNKEERRIDYINRCADVGMDALIVKAADVLDGYYFYKSKNNIQETKRSQDIAKLILEKVKNNSLNIIFKELQAIII